MSYQDIDRKLNEILELLKPNGVQSVQEEVEDVTELYNVVQFSFFGSPSDRFGNPTDRLRKIDGMHNGPAFVIERRKS